MLGPALLLATGRGRAFTTLATCSLLALAVVSAFQLQHWRTNVAVWQRAVAVAPQCPEAHENLAFAYSDQGAGHVPEQVRELRIAAQLKPGEIRGHDLLSGALISAGRLDEAIAEMQIVMRLQEQHDAPNVKLPNVRLAAYLSLGDLLLAKGRFDEAAEMFRKILRQLPGDRTAREHLSLCIYRLPQQRPAKPMMLGAAD